MSEILAGTRHDATGVIFAGDSANGFRAAGAAVIDVFVSCSAEIAAGRQPVPSSETVIIAVDLNGRTLAEVATIVGTPHAHAATGIYDGQELPSLLAAIPSASVLDAHDALLAEVDGFGCFAVLTFDRVDLLQY